MKAIVITLILLMGIAQPAWSAIVALDIADNPEPVSPEQLKEMEAKAWAGDWQLKTEFAAAFFESALNRGCDRLKYGHRCRAMASRSEAGAIFFRQVIDATPEKDLRRSTIGGFQLSYAQSRYRDAGPSFAIDSEECKEAAHYARLAFENKEVCAGTWLSDMMWFGRCLPVDKEQSGILARMDQRCPKP